MINFLRSRIRRNKQPAAIRREGDDIPEISRVIQQELLSLGYEITIASAVLTSRRPEIPLPFLMVAPDVRESDLTLERLAHINSAIIKICLDQDLLVGRGAVEILSRVVRGGILHRVMRLAVLPSGFNTAKTLSPDDLTQYEPYPGVHSGIYMKSILVSEA